MSYKPCILAADDSEAFLMYLSLILKRMGLEVIPVENGVEATKLCRILNPDMVMLDLVMPEMDGSTALRQLKSNAQTMHIPVVMISMISEKEKVEECLALGATGYLTKPVQIMKLHKVVNENMPEPNYRKRKFLRTNINQKIAVDGGGSSHEDYFAETLSEMGIYFRTKNSFVTGEPVTIKLTLKDETEVALKGNVIYTKGLYGDIFKRSPGVAVKFDNPNAYERMMLLDYITEKLMGDILQDQKEKLFEA